MAVAALPPAMQVARKPGNNVAKVPKSRHVTFVEPVGFFESNASTRRRAAEVVHIASQKALAVSHRVWTRVLVLAGERRVQVTAMSAVGGAVVCGLCCAFIGLAIGCMLGCMLGCMFALFTFGLSVPIGVVLGAALGFSGGLALGASAGFLGGGALGYGVHRGYDQLTWVTHFMPHSVMALAATIQSSASTVLALLPDNVSAWMSTQHSHGGSAEAKLAHGSDCLQSEVPADETRLALQHTSICSANGDLETLAKAAQDRSLTDQYTAHVTAAAAMVGGATIGVCGASAGLVAGSTCGAALGLIPAVFTFGLSIPFGAVVGGGCGCVAGAAAGSTSGAVGGGAFGYGMYKHRQEIHESAAAALSKASAFLCAFSH
mmetsp:Transcript_54461/g.129799  ORF Transcript_54461/g.129799 Transcript_54461/m.129799 type:complete len:375 (+) Transcript_54461:64-1188(+)